MIWLTGFSKERLLSKITLGNVSGRRQGGPVNSEMEVVGGFGWRDNDD